MRLRCGRSNKLITYKQREYSMSNFWGGHDQRRGSRRANDQSPLWGQREGQANAFLQLGGGGGCEHGCLFRRSCRTGAVAPACNWFAGTGGIIISIALFC